VVPNKAVAVAEHETKSEGEKENTAKTSVDDALHQYVHRLARAAEAGLKHRETHLHAKNQKGGEERPYGVKRIDNISSLDVTIGGKCIEADQVRKKNDGRD